MDRPNPTMIKGRGALSNPAGRYDTQSSEFIDDGWGDDPYPDASPRTELFPDKTRNIIARNQSPDVPFDRSINPYKGCEHGCVYCFARPTHAYLDLSAGIDFETKIFYKTDVAARLVEALSRPSYQCATIAMGTNTDPYQPAEKRLRITRTVLTTLLAWRHPVSIVTKGALILRDIDLLGELAAAGLASVMISVTTLDNGLKTTLEPRTAGPAARIKCIRELSAAGIPVGVLMAPVIPGLNDAEIEAICAASAAAGAQSINYVALRLPYDVKELFKQWLDTHVPDKAARVMALVRELHGGREYDAAWVKRQTGSGVLADLLRRRFEIARRKVGLTATRQIPLRTDLFRDPRAVEQLGLFS